MTNRDKEDSAPFDSNRIAAELAKQIENKIAEVLKDDPITMLEGIRNELADESKLNLVIDALVEFLKRCEANGPIDTPSRGLRITLFHELSLYIEDLFESFLSFWILQIYLDRDGFGPLGGMMGDLNRITLREEFEQKGLTPRVFQTEMLSVIGDRVFEKVTHGGRTTVLNDVKRARILANYNRYVIVIANARKTARMLEKEFVREGVSDPQTKARQTVATNYQIPEYRNRDELFNNCISASDLATIWVQKWKSKEYTFEYTVNLLKAERKKWNKLLGRHEGLKLRLVGIEMTGHGIMFYYAVPRGDKHAEPMLRYPDLPPMSLGLHPRFLTSKIIWLYSELQYRFIPNFKKRRLKLNDQFRGR